MKDQPIKISVCNRKTDTKFKNQEWLWEDIVKRNRAPIRTSETSQEYQKMAKQKRDALKDVGGFVGGWLKGGIRKNGNVISRIIGPLDADHIKEIEEFLAKIEEVLEGVQYFIYSTHSHTPEAPRLRIVIQFDREVSEDEYPALMRMIAKQIGMDNFDDTTYQANRLMFWSSCPSNGEFVFIEKRGTPLKVDSYWPCTPIGGTSHNGRRPPDNQRCFGTA